MNKQPLFSIIVPVYKVENYIDECINSVLDQTFKDFELILVDDGSPDNCPKICDEYEKKYESVRVLHKENGGLSSARNTGLDNSFGQYIAFVDSDDYWNDKTFLSDVSEIIKNNNPDMILYGYSEYKNQVFHPILNFDDFDVSKQYTLYDVIKNDWVKSSACIKIVKSDLIFDNNIRFRYGVTSEDIEWTTKLLSCCESFCVCPKNVYVYRQQDCSITHTINKKALVDLYNNIIYSIEAIQNTPIQKKDVILNYIAYQYITLLNLYVLFCEGDKEIYGYIDSTKYLSKYNLNKKVKLIDVFTKIFGLNIMLFILKIFLKVRKSNR